MISFFVVEFLQRQLKNLKDNLKKCLDKRNRMTRSGAAASSLPKCKYFEQMRFLHEKTANRPTESNIIQAETALQSEDVLDGPLAPQISVRPVVLNGTKRKASDTPSSCGSQGYKNRQERFDNAILKELESTNNAIKSVVTTDNEDEVSLYCKSLIPIISSFPVKKKRLAMIKVSQLLFELEFEHE